MKTSDGPGQWQPRVNYFFNAGATRRHVVLDLDHIERPDRTHRKERLIIVFCTVAIIMMHGVSPGDLTWGSPPQALQMCPCVAAAPLQAPAPSNKAGQPIRLRVREGEPGSGRGMQLAHTCPLTRLMTRQQQFGQEVVCAI